MNSCPHFDVSAISDYDALEQAHFSVIGILSGATALTIGQLYRLILEEVREIYPLSALAALRGADVGVTGRNPFIAAMRCRLVESGNSTWTFPPSKRFLLTVDADGSSEWIYHAGLAAPLRVPQEAIDSVPGHLIASSWQDADEAQRAVSNRQLFQQLITWAISEGATELRSGSGNVPIDLGGIDSLLNDSTAFDGASVVSTSRELIWVPETPSDGIHVFADEELTLPTAPDPGGDAHSSQVQG